jgi:hypothetical protein
MISILKSSWLRIAFQSITGGHKRNLLRYDFVVVSPSLACCPGRWRPRRRLRTSAIVGRTEGRTLHACPQAAFTT